MGRYFAVFFFCKYYINFGSDRHVSVPSSVGIHVTLMIQDITKLVQKIVVVQNSQIATSLQHLDQSLQSFLKSLETLTDLLEKDAKNSGASYLKALQE